MSLDVRMMGHFEIKIRAKKFFVPFNRSFCSWKVIGLKGECGFTAKCRRDSNEPFVIGLEKLLVYAGLVVETLEESFGDEGDEIFVALFVFCEKHKACPARVDAGLFVVSCTRCNEHISTNDWFDACFFALFVKFDSTIHASMISEGKCRHVHFFCCRYEIGYFRQR